MDEFGGKVAVVTGAASGIGGGIARQAAREGMKVVLADVEAEPLAASERGVADLGAETLAVPTDVTSAEAVQALAAAAYDRFGAVHLLCNNAGVFQAGVVWERTRADWEWVMGVNFWGVLNGIQAFVPRMLEAGEPAHIVNTSSMAGVTTVAYSGPYVVSKFACAALTECLAHDMRAQGTNIGVSCLVPVPSPPTSRAPVGTVLTSRRRKPRHRTTPSRSRCSPTCSPPRAASPTTRG